MKSSEEFKSEVYRRADIEKRRIKRRRATLSAVCCLAVVLTAVVLIRYPFSIFEKETENPKGENGMYENITSSPSGLDEYDGVDAMVGDAAVTSSDSAEMQAGVTQGTSLIESYRSFKSSNVSQSKTYPSAVVIKNEQELCDYLNAEQGLNSDFKTFLNYEVSSENDFFSRFSIVVVVTDGKYVINSCVLSNGIFTLSLSSSALETGEEYSMALIVNSVKIDKVNLEIQ